MNPSAGQRSTRDRPAKAPLSLEAIVDAAVAILQSEGLEAMSMRRVATALDTGAGSLYVYVSGRDGLIESVFDRIIATVELELPSPKRWRAQLQRLLGRIRDALVAHPGIAAAVMADPPRSEATMRLLENLLGLLLRSGLQARDAAWTADILFAQVTHAAIESELRSLDSAELARDVAEHISRLPADQFPLVTANATQLVSGDFDKRFRYAIDVIVDGALARAAR